MIKILKEGVVPKPKRLIYKATCNYCGCEFEFETEDCLNAERHPDGYITVECPCCCHHVSRKRKQLESWEIEE